jgi:2Fe-2S ferredoxin
MPDDTTGVGQSSKVRRSPAVPQDNRGIEPVPKAVFVQPDGTEKEIDVARMESLMRAAIRCNVDGVVAECGGALTCATCHVYVDPEWLERLPPPDEAEEDMLQFTGAERKANSRLSCQLRMTEALEGIRVSVPETQY